MTTHLESSIKVSIARDFLVAAYAIAKLMIMCLSLASYMTKNCRKYC